MSLIISDVRGSLNESTESLVTNDDDVSLFRRLEVGKSGLKSYVLFQKMLGNKSKLSDLL